MEKLSLYELLSFIVPGFLVIYIYNVYATYVFNTYTIFGGEKKLDDSLMLLCLSLFIGIVVHIITFKLLNFKWVKKLIYKTAQKISIENDFIQKSIPFLNQEYIQLRKHDETFVKANEAENNLFDFAYFYLEINDKIAPAKSFQSMYFWFRNMFTISLILLPVSIFIYIYSSVSDNYCCCETNVAFWIMTINILAGIIIIPTANWLREKLMEKVFWSYYVERVHKEK